MTTPSTPLENTMFVALEIEMTRLKWSLRVGDRPAALQNIDALMCLLSKMGSVCEKNQQKAAAPLRSMAGREYKAVIER